MKHKEESQPVHDFGTHQLLEEIRKTLGGIEYLAVKTYREIKEIRQLLEPHRITKSVANIFTGESPMANNALIFNVGQTSTDTITPFLADGVTNSGGTVSNVVVTFTDPSATFTISGATVVFTAVAASTSGAASGTTACTVTDTDGVVSQWNIPFTVLVNAVVPPAQLTQSVANVFSTPTP